MTVAKRLLAGMTLRDGHLCASCAVDDETLVPHHRANRGMGGRKSLDRLSNLVWLCSEDNGLIESDPVAASNARLAGLKISGHDEPSHVPIVHAVHGRVLLGDDGSVTSGLAVF